MTKYEVIIPWHGVEKGQVVELENLHPALRLMLEHYLMMPLNWFQPHQKPSLKKTKTNSRESGFFMPSKGGFAL